MTHPPKRAELFQAAATGIQGFDDLTGGGLPQDRITLLTGGPGTGKSHFALQSLVTGARRGEPGVLVSFQKSPRQIIEDAASFGWNLSELEKDRLVILDARIRPAVLKSIDLYLAGMLAGVKLVAGEIGARRIVFDSLDATLSLLGDRAAERREILHLRDWLLAGRLTTLITAVVGGGTVRSPPEATGSREFAADCVVRLGRPLRPPRRPAARPAGPKIPGLGLREGRVSVCHRRSWPGK